MRPARVAIPMLLVLAAPAGAATVNVEHVDDPGYRGGGSRTDLVVVTAGPGEANDVAVTTDAGEVRVLDSGTALVAGPGCVDDGAGAVRCARRPGASADLRVATGDGDDRVSVTPGPSYVTIDAGDGDDAVVVERAVGTRLAGGPGADRLAGAAGAVNDLAGGLGADVLVGGGDFNTYSEDDDDRSPDRMVDTAGRGLVSYAGRAEPVEVDLAAGTGGAPGEGDVLEGLEGVALGPAGGRALGTEGPDELETGTGMVDGRGGDDELHADPGATVLCGAGDDEVSVRPAAVALDCEVLDLFDVVLGLDAAGRRTVLTLATPELDHPLCGARVNGRTIRMRRGAARVVLPRSATGVRLRIASRCRKGRAPRWQPGAMTLRLVPARG